jgi:AmmeMemoRadiSam system protein B
VSRASPVRPAAVAGSFYPADPRELASLVDGLLGAAPAAADVPKALIVPHAGYIYSGPIAATAYARLRPSAKTIRRVVLLGPAHRVAFDGAAMPEADAFETPLGVVPLDPAARPLLAPVIAESDKAHAGEHSLEVQLPFLQRVLQDFTLVPIVTGMAPPEAIGQLLDLLWGGPETVLVISSDLSHYHPYDRARPLDEASAARIERNEALRFDDACGAVAVNGLLDACARRGLHAERLDLRNSGDTAGPRDRVVGYGSFAFREAHAPA